MTGPHFLGRFTTQRPVAVLMVFTAAVVFGYFSFQRLPLRLMPPLNYPTLTVRTEYPGAAPEEVENEISRPIEEALGVIGGLKQISSISRAGVSDVVLEFLWGTDMTQAAQNTLEKLDLVFLPNEAERPLLLHFDPSLDPILELSLSGSGDRFAGEEGLRRLRRLADLQIKRALEPIQGVAAVRVRGGLEEEIHVLLDEQKLRRAGLSIQTVIDRIRQENINVAGGTIQEGRSEYMVRTLNEFENLDQIADTVVQRVEGKNLYIRDLGKVVRAHKEREMITQTQGNESVQIDIYKEADANLVAVARDVVRAVGPLPQSGEGAGAGVGPGAGRRAGPGSREGLAARLFQQEGARLQVVADRSRFIKSSLDEVRNTALIGGGLAVVILFLFLRNFKTTLIVAVSIPMSVLITFAPLNLTGVSLNIMSLGGLAMGIGMLVDSSIVVLESIYRCREEGDGLAAAAIRGTAEVRGAVVASTLTSIAVFFPMIFVEGIAGQAFVDLGMAVVISLLAALLVALFFIPMLASRTFAGPGTGAGEGERAGGLRFHSWRRFRQQVHGWRPPWKYVVFPYFALLCLVGLLLELIGKLISWTIQAVLYLVFHWVAPGVRSLFQALTAGPVRGVARMMASMHRHYPRVIQWALDHRLAVLGIFCLCGVITWQMARQLETELLPEIHQGEFALELSLPVGTPLERTRQALQPVEERILNNLDDIRSLLVTYGFDATNLKRSDEGEHSARFKVLLEPGGHPAETEETVIRRLRGYFQDIPDLEMRVVRPVLFSTRTPIVVEIQGDDLVALRQTSQEAERVLAGLTELVDVEASLRPGAPEVQVSYHREQLSRFGLNISTVAQQVRDMIKGYEASRFNLKDRRIPILVRLQDEYRDHVGEIEQLTVNPGGSHPIPLEAVADLEVGEGPSEVRRIDGQRVALVEANLGTGSLGGAVEKIKQRLRHAMDWPADMTFTITGQNQEWDRSRASLMVALGLSLFLVYVIMAAQFESLLQPLIILLTIPLAFFGTVLGLLWLNFNLSIVVFLGMIMLVGIVVNNAIVLVDYINTLQGRGMERSEAIRTAGNVRLRPILMTTATTVLGLFPMALGWGEGAEIRTPMAVAVICGLITSTLLTLVVIPTCYDLVEQFKTRWLPAVSRDT